MTDPLPRSRTHFVVMGVAGSGKTSIGQMLAQALPARFVDGDDLHSPANIAKMARGAPLTDDDRWPWLKEIGRVLGAESKPIVIGCSALKRAYRDLIRETAGRRVTFLYLQGSRALIAARMAQRNRHFMPVSLLDSQFSALEEPQADEDAITVDIAATQEEIVRALLDAIRQTRA